MNAWISYLALGASASAAEAELTDDGATAVAVEITVDAEYVDPIASSATIHLLSRSGSSAEKDLACYAADGAESETLRCTGLDPIPLVIVSADDDTVVLQASLVELSSAIRSAHFVVDDVETEFDPIGAEAAWDWWSFSWVCELEPKDHTWCAGQCADKGGVESCTTKAQTFSNSLFEEPACKVTADCVGAGRPTSTIDPPEVASASGE